MQNPTADAFKLLKLLLKSDNKQTQVSLTLSTHREGLQEFKMKIALVEPRSKRKKHLETAPVKAPQSWTDSTVPNSLMNETWSLTLLTTPPMSAESLWEVQFH